MLKTDQDIAPQSYEIVQMSVWWRVQTYLPPYNFCKFLQLYIFTCLRSVTFKLGKFANFRALFPVVSRDFTLRMHDKSWKPRKGLLTCFLRTAFLINASINTSEPILNNINLSVLFYKINFKRKILKKSADACLFLHLFFIL